MLFEGLGQDIRFSVRSLMRRPGFAGIAIATLAIGIGANIAVFSLINAIVLNPLPIERVDRLVSLYTTDSTVEIDGFTMFPFSYRNYEDVERLNQVFEHVAFSMPVSLVLSSGDGEPEPVSGNVVSAGYFETLAVSPIVGRGFVAEESTPGGGRAVAVLSHSLWSRRFGADASLVGREILLNNHPHTVVGVAPRGFRGTRTLVPADQIWVPPSVYDRALTDVRRDRFLSRRGLFINAFGRLRDGVSFEEAQNQLTQLGQMLASEYPG